MERTRLLLKTTTVLAVILFVLALGSMQQIEARPTKYPYVPLITEISPFVDRETETYPWIEFYNPLEKPVDASKLKILINDRYEYSFPEHLPPVPPKGFILLQLDGKERREDRYRFERRTVVLHSPWDLSTVMKGKPGQTAIYRKPAESARTKLVGFVSWGAPGSRKSLTPERNRIWRKKWFVEIAQGSGDYDPAAIKNAKYIIGLYPGSTTTDPTDWVIYSRDEATPGKANIVPQPAMFTTSNGAVLSSNGIVAGWIPGKHARAFQFQMAKDRGFDNIIEDTRLEVPYYRPASVLPEGAYYYRVKMFDKEGRKSAWSKPMKIISKKMMWSGAPNAKEKILNHPVQHKRQSKDTKLLCLDGCASHLDGSTKDHWDNGHGPALLPWVDHGGKNCVRASISMMVSHYGKQLSQDRIAYFTEEERPGVGDGTPEGDLAHAMGMESNQADGGENTVALAWALGEVPEDYLDPTNKRFLNENETPSFAELMAWLDNNQPIMTRILMDEIFGIPLPPGYGHVRVMDGYRIDDAGEEWVRILDPSIVFQPQSGDEVGWQLFFIDPDKDEGKGWYNTAARTWVGPASAPNAREDEAGISIDSDGDGIMDFDEQVRFKTGRFDKDSDNDGVPDKEDIYGYVFDTDDSYHQRDADFDNDGLRKERDPDNDGDGCRDGAEDKNFNGKYEEASSETDDFHFDLNLTCANKPNHAIIVFDRSGSMLHPPSGPVKKYDEAASAAVLFLDTWLANSPPSGTKVGLVFYDNTAYFDTGAATNTTLETLNQNKRDHINAAFSLNRPGNGSTSIGAGLLKAMETQGFNTSSVPVTDHNRVVIVLTDGKENTDPRMDDAAVIQKRVEGQVDGYVLGIGNPVQIDMAKLNQLSDFLGHYPASVTNNLNNSDLQKFFLQVLAETQGLEFSVDPAEEIAIGQTKPHEVVISEGTEVVTFIVVWHMPDAALSITLNDPTGNPVQADMKKTNMLYCLSAKKTPTAGKWNIQISAKQTGTNTGIESVSYNLMVLEKNPQIRSRFDVNSGFYHTGRAILLTAKLSNNRMPVNNTRVRVKIKKPTIGMDDFIEETDIIETEPMQPAEKNVTRTALELKTILMAESNIRIPEAISELQLNDKGINGDQIRGDGIYSAYFNDTKIDGVYTFNFMLDAATGHQKKKLTREKTQTVWVFPLSTQHQ